MTTDAAPLVPWTPVDPVGGVLADLRIRGVFSCRAEATAPRAWRCPPSRAA